MHSNDKTHQKHAKLQKPAWGNYGRREIALLGASCGSLRELAGNLIDALPGTIRCAWLDAFHPEDETAEKIEMHQDLRGNGHFKVQQDISMHELRPLLASYDLVILNGNHFSANDQILVLDPGKEASLKRKLDRLTHPVFFIQTEQRSEPYAFVKEKFPGWQTIPSLAKTAFEAQVRRLMDFIKPDIPPVSGLVLAGGKSQRMGKDKAFLEMHDQPQYLYMAHLLQEFCDDVRISCRPDQLSLFNGLFDTLPDTIDGLGPFGAILSAFRKHPNTAWLVVACDLPLVNNATIDQLMKGRAPGRIATAFYNAETDFPDPLITIWEPKAYSRLFYFLTQGYSCPRKVLINSDVNILHPINDDWLMNINTPEELERFKLKT